MSTKMAHIPLSCRFSVVVVEKPTEPLTTRDSVLDSAGPLIRLDQLAPETLMMALGVIMRDVFISCHAQVPLAERNDSMETLGFYREHEPFGVGVQIWTSPWKAHALHAGALENPAERLRKQRIAIHDQVSRVAQEAVDAVGQILRHLVGPRARRLARDAGDRDGAGLQVDHEEDRVADETSQRQHFDGEEVGCGDHAPVRLQERLPRRPLPSFRRGLDAVLLQDSLDRAALDLVAESIECVANSGVVPARVLLRHLDDEREEIRGLVWATWSPLLRSVVLLRDEIAVPAQDRVGRRDACELAQQFSAKRFTLHGEATTLGVREAQAAAAEFLSQNTVLRLQVVDDVLLLAIHPPGEGEEEELQCDGHLGHALPWTPGFAARKGLLDAPIGPSAASKADLPGVRPLLRRRPPALRILVDRILVQNDVDMNDAAGSALNTLLAVDFDVEGQPTETDGRWPG